MESDGNLRNGDGRIGLLPASSLVCVLGPSFAGKSTWVRNKLLANYRQFYAQQFKRLIVFVDTIVESDYDALRTNFERIELHTLEELDLLQDREHFGNGESIVFIDDAVQELFTNPKYNTLILDWAFKIRTKTNTSLIFCSQVLYSPHLKSYRQFLQQASWLVFIRSRRFYVDIQRFGSQNFGNGKFLLTAFKASEEKYGYLIYDSLHTTSSDYCLRSGIFPGEIEIAFPLP